MFNCEHCWDSPCTCGHEYKEKTNTEMAKFIFDITTYHDRKEIIKVLTEMIK